MTTEEVRVMRISTSWAVNIEPTGHYKLEVHKYTVFQVKDFSFYLALPYFRSFLHRICEGLIFSNVALLYISAK